MFSFIKLSYWFLKESHKYLEPITIRDILYFPIAYIRFIYFSYKVN